MPEVVKTAAGVAIADRSARDGPLNGEAAFDIEFAASRGWPLETGKGLPEGFRYGREASQRSHFFVFSSPVNQQVPGHGFLQPFFSRERKGREEGTRGRTSCRWAARDYVAFDVDLREALGCHFSNCMFRAAKVFVGAHRKEKAVDDVENASRRHGHWIDDQKSGRATQGLVEEQSLRVAWVKCAQNDEQPARDITKDDPKASPSPRFLASSQEADSDGQGKYRKIQIQMGPRKAGDDVPSGEHTSEAEENSDDEDSLGHVSKECWRENEIECGVRQACLG